MGVEGGNVLNEVGGGEVRGPLYMLSPLSLSFLLGAETRKALQVFVQNNDCSGRC